MAKIITAASWKGGTGKTTLNVALAKAQAERKKRVLIVDLDSNCAISQIFGQIMKDVTSMEFLSAAGVENFQGVYNAAENIDIIPGNIKNVLLNNISDVQLKINLKRSGLIGRYDYIIIDPPGYLGAHTRNALFAADVLVIPGTCSRIDFEATRLFFEEVQQYGLDADTYVCVNAFSTKTNLPGIFDLYKEAFGEFLIPDPVPYITSLKKLTNDFNYSLNAAVRKRLESFVDHVTGGKDA